MLAETIVKSSVPLVYWQPPLPTFVSLDERPNLSILGQADYPLPQFVQESRLAMRYLELLRVLDWANFPERDPHRPWPGPKPHPRAAYVAAFLIKIKEDHKYMTDLYDFLLDHPALVWLLGFNLVPSDKYTWGFDVAASLPCSRHFSRVLRELPNETLQFLLDSTVTVLQTLLPPDLNFGQAVSGDTKHIIAWVEENNPKAYLTEHQRLDKTRQPKGDPDCKLGCKKKRNTAPKEETETNEPTLGTPSPTKYPSTPTNFSGDVYYWGYATGTVATKVPEWGEFVLAEYTQTFNKGDATFFFPLMHDTERRLGFRPPYGTWDAGFDAFYVYDYYHQAGGFAAVPFAERGPNTNRQFDDDGLPLCDAALAMPLKGSFTSRTSTVPHQRGRYVCPLLFPEPCGQACPIDHKKWAKDGCTVTMPTCKGARIRYQLDRKSQTYKDIYKQRTATERINSQAVELGIERPKLRNRQSITNQNTLIYVLINLKAIQRVQRRLASLHSSAELQLGS